MKTSREEWRKIVKELNSLLAQKIDFVPIERTWHYTLRVCRKRKISFEEEKAMKDMCERIAKEITGGTRRSTTAACVFWKICEHSRKLKDSITLNEICKKSKENSDKLS